MTREVLTRWASWETFLAILTLLLIACAAYAVPAFTSAFNISQAIAGISERALIAMPMALLIIAREIDLSVASILSLSSVVLGVAVQDGAPLWAAMALALATGALCGAFNGTLVARAGLPSLVVTLGTLAMFRGIGYILLGPKSVNAFPDALTDFGIDTIGNTVLPWTIAPFIVLAPVFVLVLQKSAIGRRIYAIGGSPATALYSGVRVNRVRFMLFVVSGLVCALAAIVFTARVANARADNALGLELDVITVALLGGVSVFGGKGKLTGVFWALVLVATVRNVLGLEQIGGDAQGTIIGLLLIGTLLVSSTTQRLLARRRASRFISRNSRSGFGRPAVQTPITEAEDAT
jgi:rhamnose transport system permease protein